MNKKVPIRAIGSVRPRDHGGAPGVQEQEHDQHRSARRPRPGSGARCHRHADGAGAVAITASRRNAGGQLGAADLWPRLGSGHRPRRSCSRPGTFCTDSSSVRCPLNRARLSISCAPSRTRASWPEAHWARRCALRHDDVGRSLRGAACGRRSAPPVPAAANGCRPAAGPGFRCAPPAPPARRVMP